MTSPLDASTHPLALSLITASRHNASKRLVADASGQPMRDPTHRQGIAGGILEYVEVAGLAGLRDLILRTTSRNALVHGIPHESPPRHAYKLVTEERYTGEPGTIARTKKCLTYPADAFLLMLDHDHHEQAPVLVKTPEDLLTILGTLDPVFARVGWLATVSTSSAIKAKTTPRDVEAWLTPPYGMHLYLMATGDVDRWRDWLTVKLWLADTGFCRLSAPNPHTGVASVLTRCLLDLTVFSPERLDFVAGAIIDPREPFYQDRPQPQLHDGEVLRLDALPAITAAERADYEARLQAARDACQADQHAKVRTHILTSAPTMPDVEVHQEMTRRLQQAARGELDPEQPLYFVGAPACTAGTVTKKHDGKRLAPPLEPDYGPDAAVFHWNGGGPAWRIVCWAHGGPTIYRLAVEAGSPPVPTEDDTADLLTRVEDEEDIDGLAQLARQDDHETHDLTKRYRATRLGLMWSKPTKEGPTDVLLTNFCAHIISQITEDDGAETRLHFALSAIRGAVSHTFRIPATQFAGMGWVTEQLGAEAIVLPGMTLKDHARAAIQILSPTIERRHVYTHIGWRRLAGGWVYLHAGGAVGAEGLLVDVDVEPGNALLPYILRVPESPAATQTALVASMQVLTIAPPEIVTPLYGALWRALLGMVDLGVHLTGHTGMGKSVLVALVQQHWGPTMDAKQLPASWTSTANALEALAFQAKDAILVIDDFCPRGSPAEVAQLHAKADRLFRAQGNRSARQRLDRTGRDRPAKPPRGLVVSTGEDTPQGQSLRARVCLLEVTPQTVDWERVTPCQMDAAAGLYTEAMAAFAQWLAPHYDEVLATLPGELIALRGEAVHTAHRRTPEIVANLALGWRYFLACAYDLGVLSEAECQGLWAEVWTTLGDVALSQHAHQVDEDPVRRFLSLLSGTITAGQAHVQEVRTLGPPPDPQAWGWTVRETTTLTSASQEWTPHGACVGWLDGDRLYLEPEASYSAVQRMAETQRAPLTITQRTLHKRMNERGLLLRQPSHPQNTVERPIGPSRKKTYVLDTSVTSIEKIINTFNTFNTFNTQSQQSQRVPERCFPVWHEKNQHLPNRESTLSASVPRSRADQRAALLDTKSVDSENAGVDSKNVLAPAMAPQCIEKKERVLKMLKVLVSLAIDSAQDENLSSSSSLSPSAPPAGSPIVGDWITPLSLDGVIIPANTTPPPYRIDAIEHDDHAVFYARLDVGAYWPLAQCERAAPPAPGIADEVEKGIVL